MIRDVNQLGKSGELDQLHLPPACPGLDCLVKGHHDAAGRSIDILVRQCEDRPQGPRLSPIWMLIDFSMR